jgi:hypothetical protein
MNTSSLLRRAVVAAGAVTALLALAVPPVSAAPPTRENNCAHPVTGVNLNELFGVPEQLVYACGGPTVGEYWRPFVGYIGAEASDAVYPPGYVPLHASPVDDVLAKTSSIQVVTDGGTRLEQTYSFSPTDEDAFHYDLTIHEINPAFPDLPGFIVIPRMAPLSRGHHTVQLFWVLTAQHCDGISTEEAESCLPAGANPLALVPFDVSIP